MNGALAKRGATRRQQEATWALLERKAELFDMLLADLAKMGLAENLRTKYRALAKEG